MHNSCLKILFYRSLSDRRACLTSLVLWRCQYSKKIDCRMEIALQLSISSVSCLPEEILLTLTVEPVGEKEPGEAIFATLRSFLHPRHTYWLHCVINLFRIVFYVFPLNVIIEESINRGTKRVKDLFVSMRIYDWTRMNEVHVHARAW